MTDDPRLLPTDLQCGHTKLYIDTFRGPERVDGCLWCRLDTQKAEIERLQETLTCPRLTPEAPTDQFATVLKDWEKGRPVNTQDLVNALAWRLGNQRREITRLREQLNAEIKRQQDNCNV